MGVWRNIGKIVSLSLEIIYLEMKWIVNSFKSTDKSNTSHERDTKKINNKVLDEISKLKKKEIIEKYRKEEQESLERVQWSENPHYEN